MDVEELQKENPKLFYNISNNNVDYGYNIDNEEINDEKINKDINRNKSVIDNIKQSVNIRIEKKNSKMVMNSIKKLSEKVSNPQHGNAIVFTKKIKNQKDKNELRIIKKNKNNDSLYAVYRFVY